MDRPLRLITRTRSTSSPARSRRCSSSPPAPLSVDELAQAADDDAERIETALGLLGERYREGRSGIVLERVAGGYAFRAAARRCGGLRRLFERPSERGLSQAALETLAIVAYLGPCSRPEIARIRGVAADSAVAGLVERGLIAEAGRDDGPAAPSATARRRSSSASSGSRAPPRCRGSTTSATRRRRSASGSTASPSARPPETAVDVGAAAKVPSDARDGHVRAALAGARVRVRSARPCTRIAVAGDPVDVDLVRADHEVHVDRALVDALAVGLVLDREGVGVAERDVAGGVLVDERVVEDRLERPDPALLVDERELAQPRRAVVLRDRRPERVGADVGVGLDRSPALELDPDAVHVRAEELERHRRGDVAVDPLGVGRREDLLGRQVRVVRQAVDGREVGAEPLRAREQPDRQVRARPVQVDRVEAPLGHPVRARDDRPHPLQPRGDWSSASSRRMCTISSHSRSSASLGLELGVHPLRPAGFGYGPAVQFVVCALTIFGTSATYGRMSRPIRAGSTPSKFALVPVSETRAACSSESHCSRCSIQGGT